MKHSIFAPATLMTVFICCCLVQGYSTECRQSELKILNGIETRPNPYTVMTASSVLDRSHTPQHGLAFGSTGWSPRRARVGEWIEADLGSYAQLSQVRVYLLTPGVKVRVETILDGEKQKAENVVSENRVIKAEFSPSVLANKVRVVVTGCLYDVELEVLVVGCNRRRGVIKENILY